LRLKRSDDIKASTAATMIAAGVPYRSNTRNTNVSETEICELRRGIGTVIRDVSINAIATSTAKRESTWARSIRKKE
jgi:hypothetical protein